MSNWFAKWRLNRAARAYARRLPGQLRAGWGRSTTYTQDQIDAAVRKARLDPAYLAIGYAVFLPAEALATLGAQAVGGFHQAALRETFDRWRPVRTSWSAPDGDGAIPTEAGYDGGGGHGHSGGH